MTHDDLTDDTPTTFPVGWIIVAAYLALILAAGLIFGDPGDLTSCATSPGAGVTVPGSLSALVEPGAVCSHGGGS